MGWFGKKNRANQHSQGESANVSTEWDAMAAEVTRPPEKSPEQRTLERQQRKVMGYFLGGENTAMIEAPDVAVTVQMETDFLEKMADGEFTDEDEAALLRKIRGPIDVPARGQGGERILAKLSDDPWQKQLFTFCIGRELNENDDGELVREFLEHRDGGMDLRTPVGFATVREKVMDWLEPQVSAEQMRYYQSSMDDLEQTLYGKRFEYYKAFEGLKEKAAGFERKIEVFGVDAGVSDEILRMAEINGDPWEQDGHQYRLQPNMLKEAGLEPNYQMVIDGQTICLSDLYRLHGGRMAVTAYVPTDEGVKVRSYYRSNSQGVWRYMPDYVKAANQGSIDWFGKGMSEESLTLPFELQAGLAIIEQNKSAKEITSTNPDFLFAGTAQHYASKDEYTAAKRTGQMRGDYYEEVAAQPKEAWFGILSRKKRAPESLQLAEGVSPNFERRVAEYSGQSALVGVTETEVYRSKDGKLNYLMCKDAQGRCWVGGVETRSPLTSTGLRRDWVAAGDLATPLYEYASQTDGYGDAEDTSRGYQGMWKEYVSKIPVIRQYLEHQR